MARQRNEAGEFNLAWALGISVGIHALLLLLSFFLGLLPESPTPAPAEDSVLQFTFAPDLQQQEDSSARGEIPFPTPEPQPPAQQPASEPSVPQPPTPRPPDRQTDSAPPAPQVEPLPPAEPPDTPREEPREAEPNEAQAQEAPAEERPTDEAREDLSGSELPPTEDATLLSAPSERPSARAPPQSNPVDLQNALQQFRSAVDRARTAAPPPEPGSGSFNNTFAPDPSNMPVQGSPYGILEFSSRDYDWSEYASQIYWAILRAWYNRLYQTTDDFERWAHETGQYHLRHDTKVRFVIEDSGDVTGISVQVGSGCPPLDVSAEDALVEVVLPPLPADFPRDREVVHATFIAQGEIMTMRPFFRRLKAVGYF
jgi:outer membrane biosynthesis protein TonB